VVLTRDPGWSAAGAERAGSVPEVLAKHDDVWVIGGAAVYAAFLPHADRVVRTRIDLAVAGDAWAPELGPEWRPASAELRPADAEWRAAGPEQAGWQTSRTGLRYRIDELVRAEAA
jgi:dihydrofolate reductase